MVIGKGSDEVFVDASAWVASFWPRDDNHPKAKQIWEESLWDFVQDNKMQVAIAEKVEGECLELFWKHRNQTFSVVDRANFLIILKRRCLLVFDFDDRHFKSAAGIFGFRRLF